ncbi:MAG: M3 family oligoendopeptidase [Alphaproteobacteria bacterium]|nr:M3 family oligoendopeptidase [Alphaproteobacteria bacterium]
MSPTEATFPALSATAEAKSDEAKLGILPEWNLGDLYPAPDSPEYAADLKQVEADAAQFSGDFQGRLESLAKEDGAELASAIASFEAIQDTMGRLGAYAMLRYTGNNADPERAKFFGDAQEALTRISMSLLFFSLELNRVDDGVLDAALKSDALAHYAPWLMDLRKERPYQLDDKIEELFHEKSMTGGNAWVRLFDETMAALRFEVDGEELTLEPALNLMVSPDGATRKKGAKAVAATLKENARTFALITNTLAKDKEISDRWRGFEDIADARHLSNRVERDVVDALVDAVTEAHPRLSHRYYALKAKWMGAETMPYWDRNAPLPDSDNALIEWPKAQEIVLDAYGGFAPEMADIAKRFFDDSWIDAPVREGKQTGAFAHPTVPSAHPYVLLNYQGKTRDVMTLAHELGHGVHQVLAADQGLLMAQTPLTLAETASVFGEMLTFRSLLAEAKDTTQRREMLASKVEDMLNTVVRQIAFYSFERKVHTERKNGELTAEKLGEIWMSVQGDSLGPAITFDKDYESFWSYIPHFVHSPFYVYAYAFGDCLVNSLYAVYEDAEAGFAEKYFDMLKAGGSKHHSELLKPFGLNAADPQFWRKGLGMIERMIDELEALEGQ